MYLTQYPLTTFVWLLVIAVHVWLSRLPTLPNLLKVWNLVALARNTWGMTCYAVHAFHVAAWINFQGRCIEDVFVLLCAVWCALEMFGEPREDMKRICFRLYMVFMTAVWAAALIVLAERHKDSTVSIVTAFSSDLFVAGLWLIFAIVSPWADGNKNDPVVRDAHIVATGFLALYFVAANCGYLEISLPHTGALEPVWLVNLAAQLAVYGWWSRKFA